jgi:hypothetical protein
MCQIIREVTRSKCLSDDSDSNADMDVYTSSIGDTNKVGSMNSRHNTGSILDSNGRGSRRNRPENRMRTQNAFRLGLPSASPPQVPAQLGPAEDAASYK